MSFIIHADCLRIQMRRTRSTWQTLVTTESNVKLDSVGALIVTGTSNNHIQKFSVTYGEIVRRVFSAVTAFDVLVPTTFPSASSALSSSSILSTESYIFNRTALAQTSSAYGNKRSLASVVILASTIILIGYYHEGVCDGVC